MGREGEGRGEEGRVAEGIPPGRLASLPPAGRWMGPGPSDQSRDGARHGARHRKSQGGHEPRGSWAGEQKAEFGHRV